MESGKEKREGMLALFSLFPVENPKYTAVVSSSGSVHLEHGFLGGVRAAGGLGIAEMRQILLSSTPTLLIHKAQENLYSL